MRVAGASMLVIPSSPLVSRPSHRKGQGQISDSKTVFNPVGHILLVLVFRTFLFLDAAHALANKLDEVPLPQSICSLLTLLPTK